MHSTPYYFEAELKLFKNKWQKYQHKRKNRRKKEQLKIRIKKNLKKKRNN